MIAETHPNDLEERVRSFVAQQRLTGKRKLSADTRLAEDLGIEGDDAVEFFSEFAKRFDVNLDSPRIRWDQHFLPEGSGGFVSIIVVVSSITAGFWLKDSIGVLPAWGWGGSLIVAAFLIHRHWPRRNKRVSITIADLIESARSRHWSKVYPDK